MHSAPLRPVTRRTPPPAPLPVVPCRLVSSQKVGASSPGPQLPPPCHCAGAADPAIGKYAMNFGFSASESLWFGRWKSRKGEAPAAWPAQAGEVPADCRGSHSARTLLQAAGCAARAGNCKGPPLWLCDSAASCCLAPVHAFAAVGPHHCAALCCAIPHSLPLGSAHLSSAAAHPRRWPSLPPPSLPANCHALCVQTTVPGSTCTAALMSAGQRSPTKNVAARGCCCASLCVAH